MTTRTIEIITTALALAFLAAVQSLAADDGGTGDTDTDTDTVPKDPCYLDNGSLEEVAELRGCNGDPQGIPTSGHIGIECTYNSFNAPYYDNKCAVDSACYPAAQWYSTLDDLRNEECGICLKRCARKSVSCPDGNSDAGMFDFCTSNCPEGSHCWLAGEYGLCIISCLTGADCVSGECDPDWHICVPRNDTCPEPDTDTDTGTDIGDAGTIQDPPSDPDASNEGDGLDKGGCACNASIGVKNYSLLGRFFPALLEHAL